MRLRLESTKEFFKVVLLGLAVLIVLACGITAIWAAFAQQPKSCNVAVAQLYGTVVYYPGENSGAPTNALGTGLDQTASEDIRAEIEAADANSSIKAILLQVDSPGGDPVAGEDIADALKHATKPTVALVADEGTSAAYWASTGAQTIFASADSELADIGVTESYVDDAQQNEQNGLTFESLTAGEYKDMGNPDAPLTDAEKALIDRDLNITFQNFIDQVAANRNLSVASVTAIANGSPMEGQMALQDGLIDKIGSIYDVENFIQSKIGTPAVLCD